MGKAEKIPEGYRVTEAGILPVDVYKRQALWSAVPPRGYAHGARRRHPGKLPLPGLRLHAKLADGGLRRAAH